MVTTSLRGKGRTILRGKGRTILAMAACTAMSVVPALADAPTPAVDLSSTITTGQGQILAYVPTVVGGGLTILGVGLAIGWAFKLFKRGAKSS